MTKKTTGFDLSILDTSTKSANGVEFEVKNPDTGKGLGAFIAVCGHESQQHREARDAAAEKIRNRQFEDGRKFNSPADVEDLNLETAIGDILGWRGIKDGDDVEYSKPNARKILEKYRFIVRQVSEAVHDRSRFLPGNRG